MSSDYLLMFFLCFSKDEDVVQIYKNVWDILEDMVQKALEGLSGVGQAHRHHPELVGPPGGEHRRLVAVFFRYGHVMVGLGEVNLAKDLGALDLLTEGLDVGEVVGVQEGLLVDQAEVATRPPLPRAFRL